MSAPSLETVHLSKTFGTFPALTDLNLKLEGAKCVGFLGPNGAGKTTTLKMLTDMIYPTSGEAFVNGVSVQANRKDALSSCGVLIETPEIYPSLSPREALQMVADLRGYPEAAREGRIERVLAEVKMSEWIDRKVGKFSKGMKQRVNIAAALLHDPEILLLDEPTTGLDPRGMAEVRDIIRGLKRGRRLIFMSSHILSEVSDVCDEVALVNHGRLLFHDTLANVTQRFVAGGSAVDVTFTHPIADADVTDRVARLEPVVGCERLDPTRLRLTLRGGPESQAALFEAIAGLHLGALSLREASSALEQTYMDLVAKGD